MAGSAFAGATTNRGDAGAGGDPTTGGGAAGGFAEPPTFEAAPDVTWPSGTTGFAQAITPADLDGDGNVDLALGLDWYGVAVLLGKGDGTFLLDAEYPPSQFVGDTSRVYGIAIADFNGDKQLDLAVGNERQGQSSASVGLLKGDGKAHFAGLQEFEQTARGSHVGAVAAADFDHDGWVDLVATSGFSVDVLINDAKGGFQPARRLAEGNLQGATAGDLNGDGASDIVIALTRSQRPLAVFLNDGKGAFPQAVDYAAGDAPTEEGARLVGVTIGDLDDDGAPDLVAGSMGLNGVDIFWGHGDGTFSDPLFVPTGGSCWAVGIGDLNGDARPEIAATSYVNGKSLLLVLTNAGQRAFHAGEPLPLGPFDRALTLVDLNHDGRLDIATAGQSSPNLHVWLNTTSP